MQSEVSNDRPYKVPFNILICDLSNDNAALLELVLGKNYSKLKTKELRGGDKSYIHDEWKWLFTPTQLEDIHNKLKDYSEKSTPEMKNTMLLVKTFSIENSRSVFDEIGQLPPDNQPMTVFIIDRREETEKDLFEIIDQRNAAPDDKLNYQNIVIEKRLIDKSSCFFIHNPGNEDAEKEKLVTMIYIKFYSICSYYNELGDQFIFSNNMEEMADCQVFTQRLNIIVVGRPGCGKSTFINKILGDKRCLVGGGLSKTSKIVQYHHSNYPISLYDTPGFGTEMEITNTIKVINSLNTELGNRVKQIHLILYLINSSSNRTLLKPDQEFLNKFDLWREKNNQTSVPLIFLLTKSKTRVIARQMVSVLTTDLRNMPFHQYKSIFPIEMSDLYASCSPFGMKEFMGWLHEHFSRYKVNNQLKELYTTLTTEKEVYQINKTTYFLSQIDCKEAVFRLCTIQAISIITSFALLVGLQGFLPIPFTLVLGFISLQISLVISICYIFAIYRERGEVKQWLLTYKTAGFLMLSGQIISNAIKFVPFFGTLIGGGINFLVNSSSIVFTGIESIKYCERNFNLDTLKKWCLAAHNNYNSAIDSFNVFSEAFEKIEPVIDEEFFYDYN